MAYNLDKLIKISKEMNFDPLSASSNSYFFKWLCERNGFDSLVFNPVVLPNTLQEMCEQKPIVPMTSDEIEIPPKIEEQPSPCQQVVITTRRGTISRCKKYYSQERTHKDPNYNLKKQKKNRNVLSNLVHHLLKYLTENPESKIQLEKIIQIHSLKIDIFDFYKILQFYEKKFKGYVTENNLKLMWLGEQDLRLGQYESEIMSDFRKIMRVISSQFYRCDCINSIMFSNKLSVQSKALHYQGLWDIREIITNLGEPQKKIQPQIFVKKQEGNY